MSATHVLVLQLETYAQEELDLQTRTLEILREEEHALFHGDLDAIRANGERIEAGLQGASSRAQRRAELLRRSGALFGVAPATLTLSSICTRLGPEAESLRRLAGELRATTALVARATRRLAALARMHVRLNDEILGNVFQAQGASASSHDGSGTLLDARV